tara:strand:- start:94 stop:792 length:699 start_codon:yes stop_codon:yes gene_type:complete
MVAPRASKKVLSQLKASILNPALTSHFQCWFSPPPMGIDGFNANNDGEFLSLSCAEASLPSTSLATHQMTNDFSGITEKHAYRRQYNDASSFTFYVDHDYKIINIFENWIGKIVNERNSKNLDYFYRVKFPKNYQSPAIYIKKFEKDYNRVLEYEFLKAYPVSIDSMPVTYDQSSLLKCTVNFNFSRYLMKVEPITTSSVLEGEPEDNTWFTGVNNLPLGANDLVGTLSDIS